MPSAMKTQEAFELLEVDSVRLRWLDWHSAGLWLSSLKLASCIPSARVRPARFGALRVIANLKRCVMCRRTRISISCALRTRKQLCAGALQRVALAGSPHHLVAGACESTAQRLLALACARSSVPRTGCNQHRPAQSPVQLSARDSNQCWAHSTRQMCSSR